ncbi:MAG: cob(I)yrinic acid a,c-diamide adenosyltransferase [Candidatus Magasanikbacteria bacterium]|nr:cob(I)yrinic acid a,c-diamide adenosyltransferase [Candidatus Magasanikbacteria bacterium]
MSNRTLIYTRTGDSGETSLFGGQRIAKNSLRIACIGTTDELNASLGIAVSNLQEKELSDAIESIQNKLFEVGAQLANPTKVRANNIENFEVKETDVTKIEKLIDQFDSELPELKNFILPSGTIAATQLHLSRAICRRLERLLVKLSKNEELNPILIKYINRLSDLLFVLARVENKRSGVAEKPWKK